MRTAAGQSHSPAVAGLEVTPGEVTGKLRCEALAGESEPADEGVAGRGLPGSQGELVGFWESRSGQESFVVCARTGVDLNSRPKNQIHDLCPAGAGSAGRKTGTAVAPGNQKTGEVRRPDYRSNGIRQQSREQMEVLFTLLAERYERGSVLLTSNLPFSRWEEIFRDTMTTAAAIDRLVHHCIILELNIPSYRMEQAKKNREAE